MVVASESLFAERVPRAAIESVHLEYAGARPRSGKLQGRVVDVLPGCNSRTRLYFWPHPYQATSADGCRLTDTDGHTYLASESTGRLIRRDS